MFSISTFIEGKPQKITSAVTLSFFAWVFYLSPNAYAVNENLTEDERRQAAIEAQLDKTPEQAYARRLQKLKDFLTYELPLQQEQAEKERQKQALAGFKKALNGIGLFLPPIITDEQKETIENLQTEINELNEDAMSGFADVEAHIKSHKLPKIALERHEAALEQVTSKYTEFNTKVDALLTAENRKAEDKALKALTTFIEEQQFAKSHDKTNLDDLPFGSPSPEVREPITDILAMQRYLGIQPIQLASTNPVGLLENVKTPTPEDLGESVEVQLTDTIKAKAAELNNNPVEIYTWVHNNVRFIPSFGSIQGADYTLQTLKGNAFDTASLLIALLRAAGIPARYAYGTVDIPIAKANNWVGGTEVVAATQNLMGQGGIPHTLHRVNGVDTSIRMEHVWVEAFVDFEPSGGVINIEGDDWIPMDASFKQYEFTDGLNIDDIFDFETTAIIQAVNAESNYNPIEGSIQGFPHASVSNILAQQQTTINSLVGQVDSGVKLGDILGLNSIKIKPKQALSTGLPYRLVTAKQTFTKVPDSLLYSFTYALHKTGVGGGVGDEIFTVKRYTAELAGKSLSLSFEPLTEDDKNIILSYLPDNITGPLNIPGYLVQMKAELLIDGEPVSSVHAGVLGEELRDSMKISSHESEDSLPTVNNIFVGEHHSIGLALQGGSGNEIDKSLSKLNALSTAFNGGQLDESVLLSSRGQLLDAIIKAYFAVNDFQDEMLELTHNNPIYRFPSYGKFGTQILSQFQWGIPKSISFSGLSMDVDSLRMIAVDKRNDADGLKAIISTIGYRASALEHVVPEQLLETMDGGVFSVSAVKALRLASEGGDKIFWINQENLSNALRLVNLGAAIVDEIRNAVLSGKEVLTHSNLVDYNGVVTGGYIIYDPVNGSGAYRIASGADGSSTNISPINLVALNILVIVGLISSLPILLSGGAFFTSILVGLAVYANARAIEYTNNPSEQGCNEHWNWMKDFIQFSLFGLIKGDLQSKIAGGISLIITRTLGNNISDYCKDVYKAS